MVHRLEGFGECGHPRQGRCVPTQPPHPCCHLGANGHPFLQPGVGQVRLWVWVSPVPLQGLVATLHEGDDFGQLALVNDAPRAASIILREDNCHFLRVDKQDFNRILKVGSWGGS